MLMSGETVRYELTLMKSSLFAFGAERVKSRTRINTLPMCKLQGRFINPFSHT